MKPQVFFWLVASDPSMQPQIIVNMGTLNLKLHLAYVLR